MLSVIGLAEKLLSKTLVLLTKGENIMKRVLSILLVLAMCLCLCACGNSEKGMTAKFEGKKLATSEKKDGMDGRYYNQHFLEFYSGGVGRGYTINRHFMQDEGREVNMFSFNWRIEGDYMYINDEPYLIRSTDSLKRVSDGTLFS